MRKVGQRRVNIGARAYAGRFFEGGRAIWGAYGKQAAAPAASRV